MFHYLYSIKDYLYYYSINSFMGIIKKNPSNEYLKLYTSDNSDK